MSQEIAQKQPHLVWVDCEMTGLDTQKDVLVEIAVLVTDSDLNIIGDGVDVVIHAAARSNPWGTRTQFRQDNVVGTEQVIEYCRRNGLPHLIYISSSSV